MISTVPIPTIKPIKYKSSSVTGSQPTAYVPTLKEFLIGAWENVLHPSEDLQTEGAWYIDLICEYLTLVSVSTLLGTGQTDVAQSILDPYGAKLEDIDEKLLDLRHLLINISPRCSKSTLVTVCWPCWEWLFMPGLPYMIMSYDQSLASDHNDDRRTVIKSEWFQNLSGGMRLSNSKDRVTEFKNEHQGQMVARGLNSGVTGGGGLRLIFDDPNDPNKVESDAIRNKAKKSFKDYSTTRKNNPKLTAVIVVQQRTDEGDVSGEILAKMADIYVCVIIPMEAETTEVIKFPISGLVINRKPGDLMHPDRFDSKICEGLKRDPKIWSGRYQQRPSPTGGGLFRIRNWRLYIQPEKITRTILSVDSAFKGKETSDDVVVGVVQQQFGIRKVNGIPYVNEYTGAITTPEITESRYYICDRWKGKAGITLTERKIKEMSARYPSAYKKIIEDKANGPAILERMTGTMEGLEPYNPGRDSKETRAMAMQPIQERGDVCLPIAEWAAPVLQEMGRSSITVEEWWVIYPPAHELDAEHVPVDNWAKDFIEECAMFPNGAQDGQVDMMAQAVTWLETNAPEQTAFDLLMSGAL